MTYFTKEKGSKLKDIRDTASDAVEVLRELGTPAVQESLDKARQVAIIAKAIMEAMNTREWQQNLENIRLISQTINSTSTRLTDILKEFKETGIFEDAPQLIKTARAKVDSLGGEGGISGQDLRKLSTSFEEVLQSIKGLIDELKATVVESKRSQTLRNIKETVKEASDAYRTITKSTSKLEQ